jgi:hypothetical protein
VKTTSPVRTAAAIINSTSFQTAGPRGSLAGGSIDGTLEGSMDAATAHDPDVAPGHDPTGQAPDIAAGHDPDVAAGHGPDAAIHAPEDTARHAPVVAVLRSVSSSGELDAHRRATPRRISKPLLYGGLAWSNTDSGYTNSCIDRGRCCGSGESAERTKSSHPGGIIGAGSGTSYICRRYSANAL